MHMNKLASKQETIVYTHQYNLLKAKCNRWANCLEDVDLTVDFRETFNYIIISL